MEIDLRSEIIKSRSWSSRGEDSVPATFQQMKNNVMRPSSDRVRQASMDDILDHSRDEE